jgi:endonuclease/exonuclease/phosphatase (EEP) superfamily protein YafD
VPVSAWLGLCVWLVALTLTCARLVQGVAGWSILFVGLAPFGVVLHALALALFLPGSLRGPARLGPAVGAVAALAALALHVAWVLPSYVGDHPDAGRTPDLTVVELNMSHGQADPDAVLAAVRSDHADLLVLVEVTPEALATLRSRGLDEVLPHSAGRPGPGRTGLMVFSRSALVDAAPVAGTTAAFRVVVPGPVPLTVLAAHLAQPLTHPVEWARDGDALVAAARTLPTGAVVVGDLNATPDHDFFHRLVGAGLDDAAQRANAGWQPTWPGAHGLPGLRVLGLGALDHVLVGSGLGVVSTQTRVVAGTDHRMLVARLVR